jgi:hypothetical protein
MQRRPSRQQKRQSLVISELPSLPSAGSRPGCFHTSLGCEPRSLIRVYLGWFDYSKKIEEGQPNSGLFASKRSTYLTALVEVHRARRVQAPMPQISGPNLQENHIIKTCKEEGLAVSTQETALILGPCTISNLMLPLGPCTCSNSMISVNCVTIKESRTALRR